MTAFHLVCQFGKTTTVKKMLDNAEFFGLDLTAKDNFGRTGFQIAKQYMHTDVINLIKRKMPSNTVMN